MIGWVDASSGASGDMLLGALLHAGVPLEVIASAVTAVAPEAVRLRPEPVTRGGFVATRCHVETDDTTTSRSWRDVEALLERAALAEPVRRRAHATFATLAEAEARVHGSTPADVHFHEVGALDAIADVVGVCAGLQHLGLDRLVVSPVAVGSGRVRSAHGELPVPPPAVAELLRGRPSYAGPGEDELCTPTGAALLVTHATSFAAQPPMVVERIGVGAGGRDPATHANLLRLLVGEPVTGEDTGADDTAVVLETNIDDLDPRLWPTVIAALLDAGASDAWLTPIIMKKGRPAHTLHVLLLPERVPTVRRAIFRHTSTIGLRQLRVDKTALERQTRIVQVDGIPVHVKLALDGGRVVNAQPEYDDLVGVSEVTGRPVKDVLAEAIAVAQRFRVDE